MPAPTPAISKSAAYPIRRSRAPSTQGRAGCLVRFSAKSDRATCESPRTEATRRSCHDEIISRHRSGGREARWRRTYGVAVLLNGISDDTSLFDPRQMARRVASLPQCHRIGAVRPAWQGRPADNKRRHPQGQRTAIPRQLRRARTVRGNSEPLLLRMGKADSDSDAASSVFSM